MSNQPQSEYNHARLRKMSYRRTKTKKILGANMGVDFGQMYHSVLVYPKALPVGMFR